MTTGNSTFNGLTTVQTPSGPRSLGSYARRVWDGDNSPRINGKLQLRENRYTCTLERYYTEPVACRTTPTGNPTYISGRDLLQPNNFYWTGNNDIELWTRMANKIRHEEFNLGVFLVEGKESLEMIHQGVRTLDKGFSAIAAGDHKRARRIFGLSRTKVGDIGKTGASAVLAYQLGWKPLVGSIVTAATAVHSLTNRPLYVTYNASYRKVIPPKSYLKVTPVGHRAYELKTLRGRFPAPIPNWATLGIDAPETVTWEGLPATWIIDYLAPIGDYLATVGLLGRVENYMSLQAKWWETYFQYYSSKGLASKRGEYFVSNETVELHVRQVRRQSITSPVSRLPLPSFRPLGEMASWGKALNTVSYFVLKKSKLEKAFRHTYPG